MNNTKIIDMVKNLTKTASTINGERKIIDNFSNKIKKINVDYPLLAQVKKMYRYFIDPNTSKSKKAIIGAGLLYFIMPFDVVNDFFPGLGYLDDGVAIAYVYSLLEKELNNYEKIDDNK
ncbi:MAG: YkvA family protein [Vulcanibacillus sp.]